ncbi:MAG: NADH-quinone oxidoreductase subunit, partial [Verrucomicrobia bacterium]|nr:NADH-quinone oxidoreductase subunit [Verrucomicrobiota bacterium]
MDLVTLQAIAAKNEWMAIFPELLLGCLALLLLVLEIAFPARHHRYLSGVALFGVLAIIPSQILALKLGYSEGET